MRFFPLLLLILILILVTPEVFAGNCTYLGSVSYEDYGGTITKEIRGEFFKKIVESCVGGVKRDILSIHCPRSNRYEKEFEGEVVFLKIKSGKITPVILEISGGCSDLELKDLVMS